MRLAPFDHRFGFAQIHRLYAHAVQIRPGCRFFFSEQRQRIGADKFSAAFGAHSLLPEGVANGIRKNIHAIASEIHQRRSGHRFDLLQKIGDGDRLIITLARDLLSI